MSRYRWALFSLALVALLVSSILPVVAQEEPERHGLRPDAPPYAIRGEYPVGVQNFEIPATQENERDLTATVWYPALNPDGLPEEYVYEMSFEPWETPNIPVYGHAIENAEPAAVDGPYPLVVYSHAWSSFQHETPYLQEHLASHGFVVISADHEDNWSKFLVAAPWQSEFRRPDEVRREIDFAESLTAADGKLPGLIDVEHVGITGWSHGGGTTLQAAGARMDLANYRAWCETNTVNGVPPHDDCPEILDHEQELAEFYGLDAVPEGLWPELSDDRIDAAVPLAPGTDVLGPEGIESVDVPTMFIIGSGDLDVGPFYVENDPFAQVNADRKAEVLLDEAGHLVFFNECSAVPDVVDMGFFIFCSDPIWDMNRAHDLTNHFVTAFLSAELKGDAEAAAALAPQAIDFPGVTYRAEGYAPELAALDPALEAEIDAYVAEMMDATGLPGFALGIVMDGELAYAKGFGVTNLETGTPVTPQTVFQLAEVTMAPTTLAMLQLAEAGKIDLDAPITSYLPYFKIAGEGSGDITVRHLLLNTSGVPDSGDTATDWTEMTPEVDDEAVERLVRNLAQTELLFPPGDGFEWSDIGYHILGDIVAKVTGQPFEVYMQENLLTPLDMEHSTFLLDEIDPPLLANPHIVDQDGTVIVADVFPYSRQFASANNLFSNVEDMARFAQAQLNRGELAGNRILPESYYDEMWTAYNEPPFGEFVFGRIYPAAVFVEDGLGWLIYQQAGSKVVHTYGGERGFQSDIVLAPDHGLAVITMGNGTIPDNFYTLDTATDVLGMLLDERAQ